MTLYEINDEIRAAADAAYIVDEETGEIIEKDQYIDELNVMKEEKVENIALYIKNLIAEAAAIKAEKDALAKRQKAAENKADYLKRYLNGCLSGEKFSTPRVSLSYRKTTSVSIPDVYIVPDDYLRKVEPSPDKTAIKAAIKSGQVFAWAKLVEAQSLIIK